MEGGHGLVVDAQSPRHLHEGFGSQRPRHAVRLRPAHPEREVPHVGPQTHRRQTPRNGFRGWRVWWREPRQPDRRGILVSHRPDLQTLSDVGNDAKRPKEQSLE